MDIPREELLEFLEFKYMQYNQPGFIEHDPVSIPHLFHKKQDIEIAGFLTATISWGNRKSILASARKLMLMMDDDPHRFVLDASRHDLGPLRTFVHRTFNGSDCIFFVTSLKRIYRSHTSMEELFADLNTAGAGNAISEFRKSFLARHRDVHAGKHLADPLRGSSAKRINMFLRWMVRRDGRGVDFGLWNRISPSALICPLDVHTGNSARRLGLLKRRQNDWKAALELTESLRSFDPEDPVKYDFALFGPGAMEKF